MVVRGFTYGGEPGSARCSDRTAGSRAREHALLVRLSACGVTPTRPEPRCLRGLLGVDTATQQTARSACLITHKCNPGQARGQRPGTCMLLFLKGAPWSPQDPVRSRFPGRLNHGSVGRFPA